MSSIRPPTAQAERAAFKEKVIGLMTPEELEAYSNASDLAERAQLRVQTANAELARCQADLLIANTQAQSSLLDTRVRLGAAGVTVLPDIIGLPVGAEPDG